MSCLAPLLLKCKTKVAAHFFIQILPQVSNKAWSRVGNLRTPPFVRKISLKLMLPYPVWPDDFSFDAELLTASFSLLLSAAICSEGGCREKMQICCLVGFRFFLANEVVSLFSYYFLQNVLFLLFIFGHCSSALFHQQLSVL